MSIFKEIIHSGIGDTSDNTAIKKMKMFNIFCLMWVGVKVFYFFSHITDDPYPLIFYVHIVFISLISTAFFLHRMQYRKSAYLLFITGLFLNSILFGQLFFINKMMEYFMLLPCLVSLILIDDKRLNRIIFALALLGFVLPNLITQNSPMNYSSPHLIMFFFIIYGIVLYFKNLNSKNELALVRKKQELEELISFQSQFFVNISHEIRTPITLIKGLNEQNASQQELQKIHRNCNKIAVQVQHIEQIVDDVLDLAKMDSQNLVFKFSAVNIQQLLARIYETFISSYQQKGVDFTLQLTPNQVHIEVDSLYFERALNNIISNALKYTPKGNSVYLFLSENHDETVTIAVKDTGIGLNPKDQAQIFNRFYQAKNDINLSGGSGIGLAFSKEIIEKHGSTIQLTSQEHVGSTFSITMKKAFGSTIGQQEVSTRSESISVEAPLAISSTKNVLIVEDHLEMQAYIRSILPCKSVLANNGQQALEYLEKHPVDLVISDYMMPVMNGHELAIQLKKLHPQIPLIVLTARADRETKLELLKLGVAEYINKPFESTELQIRVQNLLHRTQEKFEFQKTQKIQPTSANALKIQKMKAYVHDNLDVHFTAEAITDEFLISKSSLYRLLKSETGLSPANFIKECKLEKAKLLSDHRAFNTIKELSFAVGYSKPEYFSQQYFERFGIKPLK